MIVALSARAPGRLSGVEIAQVTIVASRYLAIGLVVATYFTWRKVDEPKDATDAEQQPLIPKNPDGTPVQSSEEGQGSQSSTAYGSTSTTATSSTANSTTGNSDSESSTEGNKDDSKDKDDKAKKSDEENTNELPWERRERKRREEMEKRLKENGNWFDYAKRFMVSLLIFYIFLLCYRDDEPTLLTTNYTDLLPLYLARQQPRSSDPGYSCRRVPSCKQRPQRSHPSPAWYYYGQLEPFQ